VIGSASILVVDALRHVPAGTPIEVSTLARGERPVLQVRDHGQGMSAGEGDGACVD
jgi:two-component system OmpR family sensor kinase